MFQSTPPRGGRHKHPLTRRREYNVSIHAPAWGATLMAVRIGARSHVSIHAPAWGATSVMTGSIVRIDAFQSTPPRGGRHPTRMRPNISSWVSIHAPAWGATLCHSESYQIDIVSIHAPAWGATRVFAAPRGDAIGFNPRPRVGGDVKLELARTTPKVFQSTPPRGGRPNRACWNLLPLCGFNPRPRVGGDHWLQRLLLEFQRFNPRPRVGGDASIVSACHYEGNNAVSANVPHVAMCCEGNIQPKVLFTCQRTTYSVREPSRLCVGARGSRLLHSRLLCSDKTNTC